MSLQKFKPDIYKILEKEAKELPQNFCDCPCHNFGLFHHNPCLSVLSNLQCFECVCMPISFNASEISRFQSEVSSYWKKINGYPRNMVVMDRPEWIRNESVFMRVLLQYLSKQKS